MFDAPAAGVSELCDAFKVRYLHESQHASGAGGAGGKTPYGAGRMTPARTPAGGFNGSGQMSVRHPGPSHPPKATPVSGTTYGGATTYGPPPGYGFQTPRPGFPPQQPPVPSGLNPSRAAVMQNTGPNGGWGSSGRWS